MLQKFDKQIYNQKLLKNEDVSYSFFLIKIETFTERLTDGNVSTIIFNLISTVPNKPQKYIVNSIRHVVVLLVSVILN